MKPLYYIIQYGAIAVIVAAIIIAFASCKTVQTVSNTDHQQVVVIEHFDTIVTAVPDSAATKLLIRCDSLGNAYLANLQTEQGKRIRLEMQLQSAQQMIGELQNTPTPVINQPLLVMVDCKEDSLQMIVQGLRERITELESNTTETTEYVKYVPDYYRNCTRGFWVLLIILALIVLWWVADYIPILSKYKTAIKLFFKFKK